MRILYLSHYALPHVGGIEVVVDALAREMEARGHDVVHVAAEAGGPGDRRPGGALTVPVAAFNGLEHRLSVPYPVFSPALVGALRRELAAADVVHAHGFLYMPCALGLGMARRRGLGARVLTEHVGHVPYDSHLLDRLEAGAIQTIGRRTARSARAVIVLNRRVRDEIEELGPGGPVLTIPNGVDLERYRPAEPGEREAIREALGWDERPRALFAGRLVPKKGVQLAVAAAEGAGGAFELILAGAGPAPRAAYVRGFGELAPEDLARLYRAADALVLPSTGEGFPLTAQEAMASGLPVVLREEPDNLPYVDGAGPGARLAAPDPAAIEGALRALFADPEARREAGRRARAHAEAAFDWGASADRHEGLYEELLG